MPSWDRPQSREDTRASAHADTAAPTPPPLQALPPFPRGINGIHCPAAPGGETLNSTKSVSWSPHAPPFCLGNLKSEPTSTTTTDERSTLPHALPPVRYPLPADDGGDDGGAAGRGARADRAPERHAGGARPHHLPAAAGEPGAVRDGGRPPGSNPPRAGGGPEQRGAGPRRREPAHPTPPTRLRVSNWQLRGARSERGGWQAGALLTVRSVGRGPAGISFVGEGPQKEVGADAARAGRGGCKRCEHGECLWRGDGWATARSEGRCWAGVAGAGGI